MAQVVRFTLPGYNVLTDTDIDHFALYSDEDYILIKEKARGSSEVAGSSTTNIAHGLSYVPFVIVFVEISSGQWIEARGDSSADVSIELTTTNLVLRNSTISAKVFKYFIFYDQQV
jgi:hypothetical protein